MSMLIKLKDKEIEDITAGTWAFETAFLAKLEILIKDLLHGFCSGSGSGGSGGGGVGTPIKPPTT